MSVSTQTNTEAVRAARIIEKVVGNAWATDPAGRFTYVTPAVLAFLDLTLEELNSPSEGEAFGWKKVIHPEDYADAAAAWRRCLQTGDHYSIEHRMLRANGVYGWGRCSGQPVRDSLGRIAGWYGTVIDGDALPHANEQTTSVTEVTLGQRDQSPPNMDEVHPHDRAAVAQASARAFFHSVPQVTSYRQLQADGSYRWIELRVEPEYGASVDTGVAVAMQDDPWTAAQSLGETAEAVRAAQIIENLYGGAWALDARGMFTYATPTSQTSIGMTLEDLNRSLDGRDFIDGGEHGWKRTVHPDDYDRMAAAFRHGLITGTAWNVEYRILRANGDYVWHRVGARPTRDGRGRVTGWYGISLDIDVYKKTEAALRERERELSQLIDLVPSHVWRLTPDGQPTFFNKRMIDFLGPEVANADKPGMTRLVAVIQIAVHPEDAGAMVDTLNRSLATGETFSMRYRLRRADGVYRWMSSRAEPMRDQSGRIVQWYGLCHDIDDQMHAEEALRESERLLRQLVETVPAMIDCAAPDGEPIYRSQQLRDFLGYDLEDLDKAGKPRLQGTLDAGVHPDDLADVKKNYAHSLSTGEPYARKHRLRRFDGEYRWVETRAAAMRNAEGAIVQWSLICLDIENEVRAQGELRLARERLARASQAASLAELSASIAHEVNQPLAAVVANSHACQRWLAADPPNIERAQKTVERITRDANAAADVVSRIRALFRQSVETRNRTALASIVAEVRDLMAEDVTRRRIRVDIDAESDLPLVALDRVQIQQVLINLLRNGMEAMDSVTGDRALRVRVYRSGDVVRTEISDRGHGILSPDRIFEPFFTTKQDGMGMGLAICRSIIESHGGRLWAEKESRGATFIFTLPAAAEIAP